MTCRHRFAAHDGLDVRLVAIWPSLARFALCAGCRRAAAAMGMDLRAAAA